MNKPSIDERRMQLKKNRGKQLFLFVALAFGLALVAGIIIDIKTIDKKRHTHTGDSTSELQDLVLGMDATPYTDPGNLFSIVPPRGWTVTQTPAGTPYNVSFRSPNGPEINIIATRVDYNNFAHLKRDIKNNDRQLGINDHMEEPGFIGREAVRRTLGLNACKVITYDFVEDNVAHHIQVSIPHSLTNKYEPVLMDIIETYEPTPAE